MLQKYAPFVALMSAKALSVNIKGEMIRTVIAKIPVIFINYWYKTRRLIFQWNHTVGNKCIQAKCWLAINDHDDVECIPFRLNFNNDILEKFLPIEGSKRSLCT